LRDGGDGWAMTEGIEATNNVDREMGGKIFTFESVGLLKFGQGQFITI
jgi:poly(A) polymerase Pap1